MKKGFLKGIAILTTVCTLLTTGQMDTLLAATAEGVSDVVQGIDLASDTEVTQASGTFNLSDWKYTQSGSTITLSGYRGSSADVVISGTTVKDGVTCNIAIASGAQLFLSVSGEKNPIKTITIQDGVKFGNESPQFIGTYPNLQSVTIGKVDLSACTSLSKMFQQMPLGESTGSLVIDFELGGNTASNSSTIKDMSYMFDTNGAKKVILANFSNDVCTDMTKMFHSCEASQIVFSNFKTPSMTTASHMFDYTYGISTLDVSSLDFSKVTDMSGMFYDTAATTIKLGAFNAASATTMNKMFSCGANMTSKLKTLSFSKFYAPKCTDFSYMFYDCKVLASIDFSTFDTSSATTMAHMFDGCTNLSSVKNLSGLDTANATTMGGMFANCSSLTSIDISKLNLSSMKSMSSMFYDCTKLAKVNIGPNNTSKNLNTMANMFNGCRALTSINLKDFTNSTVSNFAAMFEECVNLTSIDLSGFKNDSNITSVQDMFHFCPIEVLDLSMLDFSNVTSTSLIINYASRIIYTPKKPSSTKIQGLGYNYDDWYICENGKIETNKAYFYLPTSEQVSGSVMLVYSPDQTHVWSSTQLCVEKTCYSDKKGYKCLLCEDVNWTTVGTDYLPHDEVATVTQKAGIGTNGITTYTCKNYEYCRDSRTVEFAGVGALTIDTSEYAYDGNPKTPGVKVTDTDGNVISSDSYSVEYLNNTDVGTATAKVTMTGNYTGTLESNFTITKAATNSKSEENATGSKTVVNETYSEAKVSLKKVTAKITSKKAKHKAIKLKWKKLSGISGYQIQASTSKKFSKKTTTTVKIEGANKTSTTIKKLKAKKKYYVRIRAYKNVEKDGSATQVYTSWSKKTSVKTKK